METDLKSHLKDWRSQQLNHLPSITNLAYAKPFLSYHRYRKKELMQFISVKEFHTKSSMLWKHPGSLLPKTFCIHPLVGRVMASVFQNSKGVLLKTIIFLLKDSIGLTILINWGSWDLLWKKNEVKVCWLCSASLCTSCTGSSYFSLDSSNYYLHVLWNLKIQLAG